MQDGGKLSAALVSLSHSNHVSGKLERIRHETNVCMLVDVSVCRRRMLRRQRGKEEKKYI